ncbi:interferon-inducible protein AIM2-like [Notamacropus eugenii]|uniref:interferon-inducible protein AIM2-like n=1 Tax=Notamacropus eugenii TaxID=9315 RepID=UPI003B67904C
MARLNPTDAMKNAYGVMLLRALDELGSEEFKKYKFFLNNEGLMTRKQDQADKTDLSKYLIEKFGALPALKTTIKLFKDMNLNETAQRIQNEISKAEKKYKKKEKKPVTRNNEAQMRSASNGNNTGNSQVTKKNNLKSATESKKNCVAKKRKATTKEGPESKKMKTSQDHPDQKTEPETEREDCCQTMPMTVKVLQVSQIFEYEIKGEKKEMFHATVANEHEFIRVKVFNLSVKEHINKNKIIEISNGYWKKGFLEINRFSRVQDVPANKEITVPQNIKRRAGKTTKIQMLVKQKQGSYVDGVYAINKKTTSEKCTFFEVKDNTGEIQVVTFGKWAKINCEIGDKLRLICFELSSWKDMVQLKSVTHSFVKVIKAKKK